MAEKGSATQDKPAEALAQGAAQDNSDSRSYIVVPMPTFMRQRFIAEAKAADKPTGPYMRDLIAQQLGIELPPSTTSRRSKYASPEEAKAAQKAKAKARNELIKALLEEYRQNINPNGAEQPAEAATETA